MNVWIALAAAALAVAVVLLWMTNAQLRVISERMVRLDEVTRDVRRVGESIGGLEQILASPKLRGGLGEWTLEALLYEVLPHAHVMRQQRLRQRGVIVDCAVLTGDGRRGRTGQQLRNAVAHAGPRFVFFFPQP